MAFLSPLTRVVTGKSLALRYVTSSLSLRARMRRGARSRGGEATSGFRSAPPYDLMKSTSSMVKNFGL